MLYKKVLLKILQISLENTCPRVSFLIPKTKLISKLFWIQTRVFVVSISYVSTEAATRGVLFKGVLKKRLWRRCVPVNFVKYLRTYFLQNTYGRLLLYAKTSLTEKRIAIETGYIEIFTHVLRTDNLSPRHWYKLPLRMVLSTDLLKDT